jgi:hypothetical protein
VQEGRSQAKRKAAVCRAQAEAFVQNILGEAHGLASYTFVPVVLCNLPLGASFVDFSEPGITDLYLFTKFIREGEIGLMMTSHAGSEWAPAQNTISLHENLETAEANIGHFLQCSPLIDLYRNAVRPSEGPIPLASNRILYIEDWFVDPDELLKDITNVGGRWKERLRGGPPNYIV